MSVSGPGATVLWNLFLHTVWNFTHFTVGRNCKICQPYQTTTVCCFMCQWKTWWLCEIFMFFKKYILWYCSSEQAINYTVFLFFSELVLYCVKIISKYNLLEGLVLSDFLKMKSEMGVTGHLLWVFRSSSSHGEKNWFWAYLQSLGMYLNNAMTTILRISCQVLISSLVAISQFDWFYSNFLVLTLTPYLVWVLKFLNSK